MRIQIFSDLAYFIASILNKDNSLDRYLHVNLNNLRFNNRNYLSI